MARPPDARGRRLHRGAHLGGARGTGGEASQSRRRWNWPLNQGCFPNGNAAGPLLKVRVSAGVRVRHQAGTW